MPEGQRCVEERSTLSGVTLVWDGTAAGVEPIRRKAESYGWTVELQRTLVADKGKRKREVFKLRVRDAETRLQLFDLFPGEALT